MSLCGHVNIHVKFVHTHIALRMFSMKADISPDWTLFVHFPQVQLERTTCGNFATTCGKAGNEEETERFG